MMYTSMMICALLMQQECAAQSSWMFADNMPDDTSEVVEKMNSTVFENGCSVGVLIGNNWSDESGVQHFVLYLEITSNGSSIDRPWTLIVESPAYLDVDRAWNIDVKEAHDGYFEGTVTDPWSHDPTGQLQIVDLGFILTAKDMSTESTSSEDSKFPQFVSADGQACATHMIL